MGFLCVLAIRLITSFLTVVYHFIVTLLFKSLKDLILNSCHHDGKSHYSDAQVVHRYPHFADRVRTHRHRHDCFPNL